MMRNKSSHTQTEW